MGGLGTSLHGWALAMQGQGEEGMAQVRQGITAWRATGAALNVPYLCTLLAEISDHLGHIEDGLQALAEAHTLVEQHEERWWEAEICRLRGVLLLRQPGTPQAEAEAWLQRALDVARRQEAKSLELRAAMSLSRLWQQQGKQAEARALLAPIYGWFTEGFDTADLQEAKALLETRGGEDTVTFENVLCGPVETTRLAPFDSAPGCLYAMAYGIGTRSGIITSC